MSITRSLALTAALATFALASGSFADAPAKGDAAPEPQAVVDLAAGDALGLQVFGGHPDADASAASGLAKADKAPAKR